MMKTVHVNFLNTLLKALLPLLAFLIVALSSFKGIDPSSAHYSLQISKNLNNKKHKIRLYPAPSEKAILFTVNGMEGKNYQLFIFDLDGKLTCQALIHNRQTTALKNISVGAYEFEVLVNDEKVESGQLTIK